MPKPAKRIRVYGQPKQNIDPDLLVQVLILLGRELHQQRLAESAPPPPEEGTRDGEAAS